MPYDAKSYKLDEIVVSASKTSTTPSPGRLSGLGHLPLKQENRVQASVRGQMKWTNSQIKSQ